MAPLFEELAFASPLLATGISCKTGYVHLLDKINSSDGHQ